MIRKILSVILGYVLFVITSLAFFYLMDVKPHADPSYKFMMLTAAYGTIVSLAIGIITHLVAKTNDLKANFWLAFFIACFATFSYFKSDGNHYTQILAIFVFAPASLIGGLFYNRRFK